MGIEHKYARVEWERRFLLAQFPAAANIVRVRRLSDRYITGTGLRLREIAGDGEESVFKLTQKLPERNGGARQGLITTMRLSSHEFALLAQLPASTLTKTRHSMPPFGIDVFDGELSGLVLAEAEFDSEDEAAKLTIPAFVVREVTDDHRFTGGNLVAASREELVRWLQEYGIQIPCSDRVATTVSAEPVTI